MRNQWIFLLIILGSISGCEKSKNKVSEPMQGMYIGTFQRISPQVNSSVSNVILTFSNEKWNGQSDISKYPALCSGTFKNTNDKLFFTNECAWTAEFDWTLILSGEYEYRKNGDSLIIKKYKSVPKINSDCDLYLLSLPKPGLKESLVTGTWVEAIHKTDTLAFSTEYDGLFPVFTLKRSERMTDGYLLPGYFSGPYWYILGQKTISLQWFLSSNSSFNRYFFEIMPDGNELKTGSFFSDPPKPSGEDTLTFVKIIQ